MTYEDAKRIIIRHRLLFASMPDEVLEALDFFMKRDQVKDQFIYALTACGCLLKDGKTWYEHNELIKCFEDLGLFEEEPFINKPCVSSGVCEHDKNEVLDRIKEEIGYLRTFNPYTVAFQQDVLNVIDKHKTESEVLEDGNND